LAGTVFLLVEYDWSAWWVPFAFCLLGGRGWIEWKKERV